MIRKFVLRGSLFLLPLIILPVIIGLGYYLHHPAYLNLPDPSKKILILGDSHTECGINDSIFRNSQNYSETSEPYMYCYAKLQMLCRGNFKVDTLLLSVNPRSLAARSCIPGIYKFKSTLCLLDRETLLDYFDELPLYMAGRLLRPFWQKPRLEGGFEALPYCKLEKDLKLNAGKERNSCITYPLQLTYLKKIVELCQENEIVLYFINVPMYRAELFFNMDNFYRCIETNFSDIPLLDYVDLPMPDSCFADTGHLNAKGAALFSEVLEKDFPDKFENIMNKSAK